MSEIITTTGRSISTITTEIRTITRQTQQLLLSAAIEIGCRLTEAKALVPHGEWGSYLQTEVEFSQSTANNFMRLYEEYGDRQESLFAPNSQAFENLSYTKALRLLALPAEERAEFAESHDVESMSTRELEKAIKERDEARAETEKVKQRSADLQQTVMTQADLLDTKDEAIENRDKLLKEAQAKAEAAEQKLGQVTKLEAELKKAKEARGKAEQELKAIREKPQVPEAMLEAMRREALAEAAKKAQQSTRQALEAAREQAQKAERERDEAQAKLDAATKATRISDPNLQAVQVLCSQMLTLWNTTLGHQKKAVQTDPANEKPTKAFLRKLLETMEKGLEG